MKLPLSIVAVSAFAIALPVHAQSEEPEAADEAVEVEQDPSERIRCVTRRVTGSNARRHRICMTVGEWQELARGGNRDAQRIVGWGAGCPDATQC